MVVAISGDSIRSIKNGKVSLELMFNWVEVYVQDSGIDDLL